MTEQPDFRKLLEAGTPGPRGTAGRTMVCSLNDAPYPELLADASQCVNDEANAALIVAAVNALPAHLARIAELEAALKPFAQVVSLDVSEFCSDSDWFAPMSPQHARAPRLTVGDLRRARAALSGGKP